MASARTVMAAEKHMTKKMWSFAVLDAANKNNYLAAAKMGKLQASPNVHISFKCPGATISNPSDFLP